MVTESDKPDAKPYVREEDQYRLERPGVLAMREYVPGASFFIGNKIITSHGLFKHWTGTNLHTAIGFRGLMAECVNGHRFYSCYASMRISALAPSVIPPSARANRNRCCSPLRVEIEFVSRKALAVVR